MAAAFALGAEGVQMGTRMVSAAESPVHDNYKQLIVESAETGTVMLNRFHKPGFRVLATPYSEAREQSGEQVPMASLDGLLSLYFDGDLDAAFAFGGQVAGRIDDGAAGRARSSRRPSPSSTTPCRRSRRGVRSVSALDGLRVLEVSDGIAGAYAGKLLRDQGAEVVKVERAGRRSPAALVGGDARRAGRRHRRAVRVPQRRQGERRPRDDAVRRRRGPTWSSSDRARRRRDARPRRRTTRRDASSRSVPTARSPACPRRSSRCRRGAG